MIKCEEAFCVSERHEGDDVHMDVTGTTWRTLDESGAYEIIHTNHNPWTD